MNIHPALGAFIWPALKHCYTFGQHGAGDCSIGVCDWLRGVDRHGFVRPQARNLVLAFTHGGTGPHTSLAFGDLCLRLAWRSVQVSVRSLCIALRGSVGELCGYRFPGIPHQGQHLAHTSPLDEPQPVIWTG